MQMNKLIDTGLLITKLVQLLKRAPNEKQSVHRKPMLVDNILLKKRIGRQKRKLKNRHKRQS